jgi:hypothetical protein
MQPGGLYDGDNEWSKYMPADCCEKLERLLRFSKRDSHEPFFVKTNLLDDPAFRKRLFAPIEQAWHSGGTLSAATLEEFYSEVLDASPTTTPKTMLPFITKLGETPMSWFVLNQLFSHPMIVGDCK